VKLEVTEGADPTGWTSTDVLALTAISEALNPDTQQLNEFGGSLDSGETIAGAFKPVLTARGAMRGSGTPALPIPPFSALMQSAGFIETLRAATLPAAAAQTCTAGTVNTVTFDGSTGTGTQWPTTTAAALTGATAVIGEVVELAGNPSTPTIATIVDYTVSANNRIVTLSRPSTDVGAGATYTASTTIRRVIGTKWVTGSPSPHPSVYSRQFRDGIMQEFSGCRPNARFTCRTGTFAEFEFAIGGQFVQRTDVAVPAAPTFLSPPVGVNGSCTFNGGGLSSTLLAIQEFSVDLGNQGQYPDNLNALSGVDPYLIGSRKITGNINPLLTVTTGATGRNLIPLVQNGTKGQLTVIWGPKTPQPPSQVGNRASFCFPNAKFLDDAINEDNVVLRENVPFEPTSFDNGFVLYAF